MHDFPIDNSPADYRRAIKAAGSIDQLYCDYFDKQLELIETFQPTIVGHFDLIRMHDPHYALRWQVPAVRDRALRNLERIKALGLILDLNMWALAKGADEPYLSEPWMTFAIAENIAIALGDDSHGVASVGATMDLGAASLVGRGGHTNWTRPTLKRHRI